MLIKVYYLLSKGLRRPLMCIAYRLQVLDSILERIASVFESLDLIFEAFN